MRIAVTYSSREGLRNEFRKASCEFPDSEEEPPLPDFFAEGDSPETINRILGSIRSLGHEVSGVEADDSARENLLSFAPHLVFNIAENLFGDFRESYIPMLCERERIPYTGSTPLTLALCLNKTRCKEILSYYRIPTPKFLLLEEENLEEIYDFEYPAIIKPNAEGSSKGIFNNSVVTDADSARKLAKEKIAQYRQPVLMEQFLEGREFTVALWGNGRSVEVLPLVEIVYEELPDEAWPIYSYEAKWIWDVPEKPLDIFRCPAVLEPGLKDDIEKTVRKTFEVLDIKDWCRIDVRLDSHGTPNILEINPLPGVLPKPEDNSCFPKAARTAGYPYEKMIEQIICIASERHALR